MFSATGRRWSLNIQPTVQSNAVAANSSCRTAFLSDSRRTSSGKNTVLLRWSVGEFYNMDVQDRQDKFLPAILYILNIDVITLFSISSHESPHSGFNIFGLWPSLITKHSTHRAVKRSLLLLIPQDGVSQWLTTDIVRRKHRPFALIRGEFYNMDVQDRQDKFLLKILCLIAFTSVLFRAFRG